MKTESVEDPSYLLNSFTILWKHSLIWEIGYLVTGENDPSGIFQDPAWTLPSTTAGKALREA